MFTKFSIDRVGQNGDESTYNGVFTGTPEEALDYQSKKLGINHNGTLVETKDYYLLTAGQGRIALTVQKESSP